MVGIFSSALNYETFSPVTKLGGKLHTYELLWPNVDFLHKLEIYRIYS